MTKWELQEIAFQIISIAFLLSIVLLFMSFLISNALLKIKFYKVTIWFTVILLVLDLVFFFMVKNSPSADDLSDALPFFATILFIFLNIISLIIAVSLKKKNQRRMYESEKSQEPDISDELMPHD